MDLQMGESGSPARQRRRRAVEPHELDRAPFTYASRAAAAEAAVGLGLDRPERITRGRREESIRAVAARERNYRWALAAADLVAAGLAPPIAATVTGHQLHASYLFVLPAIVVVSKALGLYDRDELVIHKATTDELPRIVNLTMILTLLIWLGRRYVMTGFPGGVALLTLWCTLMALTCIARIAGRRIAGIVSTRERCLLLGDSVTYRRLTTKFSHGRHIHLVGYMHLDELLGHRTTLDDVIADRDIHRIIIAASHAGDNDAVLDLVREAKGTGLRVSLLPGILGAVGSSVVFDELWGVTVLGVPRFGLTRSSSALKRTFDLAIAFPLTLILAPVLVAIAGLIRLDSAGPIFFHQTRVGRNDRRFRILKFRTMVEGAEQMRVDLADRNEAVGLFKIADDPRITRVGRYLRSTCLDELPQLINVLRGEMSLVGPRPLVVDEDQRITGFDRRRLHLTPGMTGPWQILGSARVPLSEMVKLDYLYVATWSLWSDVKILLRTLPLVLERRGQ